MGREIRRVPPDWKHPFNEYGDYKPLFDDDYDTELTEWIEGRRKWRAGEDPAREKHKDASWSEYWGEIPNELDYRPQWPEGSATAYQVYETVSEGTPISPVFATSEELIDWLCQKGGASGMGIGGGRQVMSRVAAERFVDAGSAPSMMFSPATGVASGTSIFEEPK